MEISTAKMTTSLVGVFLLVLCLSTNQLSEAGPANRITIQSCLKNCGQCEILFGDYFMATKCAKSCIQHRGRQMPDCHDAPTIMMYLDKMQENNECDLVCQLRTVQRYFVEVVKRLRTYATRSRRVGK